MTSAAREQRRQASVAGAAKPARCARFVDSPGRRPASQPVSFLLAMNEFSGRQAKTTEIGPAGCWKFQLAHYGSREPAGAASMNESGRYICICFARLLAHFLQADVRMAAGGGAETRNRWTPAYAGSVAVASHVNPVCLLWRSSASGDKSSGPRSIDFVAAS